MYITNYYDCTHNMKVCQYRYKSEPPVKLIVCSRTLSP